MLQCVAEMCCKRRHVRLLFLLGTSCEVSPSAATGGTSECAGAFWGRKNLSCGARLTARPRVPPVVEEEATLARGRLGGREGNRAALTFFNQHILRVDERRLVRQLLLNCV